MLNVGRGHEETCTQTFRFGGCLSSIARILVPGDIFACGIHAWAVMSNHLHIVVYMSPSRANGWLPEEVATRWVRLCPAHNAELCAQKIAAILENPELIVEYRAV